MASETANLYDEARNYVGGEWRAPSADGQDVLNPATGEPFATVGFSSAGDVDDAVGIAREAFGTWRNRPIEERIQPLFAFKELLEQHQNELAELLVTEHGKTLAEARGELRRGIENVETACGMPTLMQAGHVENAAPGIDETAVRKPLGVFAAVTPFNFPGMIPLWFLPYAVAAGNSFILKPSEQTPLTAQKLFELVDEAGFPDGVVQLVHGSVDTVDAILEHDDVEGISFVGSTPVARTIYEKAAASGKRVQAQGGAKNHVVVSKHADLEFAAEQTVGSAFANSGQRCLANPMAVVVEDVYDEFTDRVVERAADITVGDGLNDDTDMGPVVSTDHARSIVDAIETGIDDGADLLLDGRDASPDAPENYLGPTVFGDVEPGSFLASEEIFGPVLGVARVEEFDDAVEYVNASQFGNAASLFTRRGAEARQFKHDVEAGNLAINVGTAAPMAFYHFGGRKASFFGDLHAQGEDMIHFYTDETVVIERWPDS